MGYAQRNGAALRGSLAGLRVAVDVQHLYRPDRPADRGAAFTLSNGTHTDEATATLGYSAALSEFLRGRGATVFNNNPLLIAGAPVGLPPGTYHDRNHAATVLRAHIYLACHLDAGGGHYGLVEHMAGSTTSKLLAVHIAHQLEAMPQPGPGGEFQATGPIRSARTVAIEPGQRGAVCIAACNPRSAAVLLEPFFGDTPEHEPLLSATGLVAVGQAIGEGVAGFWRDNGDALARRLAGDFS